MYLLDGGISFDQDDTPGLAGRDDLIGIPDTLEEVVVLLLEAGFIAVSASSPGKGSVEIR